MFKQFSGKKKLDFPHVSENEVFVLNPTLPNPAFPLKVEGKTKHDEEKMQTEEEKKEDGQSSKVEEELQTHQKQQLEIIKEVEDNKESDIPQDKIGTNKKISVSEDLNIINNFEQKMNDNKNDNHDKKEVDLINSICNDLDNEEYLQKDIMENDNPTKQIEEEQDRKSHSSGTTKSVTSDTIEEMKQTTRELLSNHKKNFDNMCLDTKIRDLVDYCYDSSSEDDSGTDIKKEDLMMVNSDHESDAEIEFLGSNKQLKKEERG